MSKGANIKSITADLSNFSKSTFSLTFAIEILGVDVWHDCNEGWIDLGPCVQGLKIQYQLYPGQTFDLDILIWPHVAKIWYGTRYGWVRTWQFLERRFLTFSIRHIFPVRVADLQTFTATINPTFGLGSLGSIAKNDKNVEVYIPHLKFGDQRYFAPVIESEQPLIEYIVDLIWSLIVNYIPVSPLDGVFDIPGPVNDVRHQDTIMYYVKEAILTKVVEEVEEPPDPAPEDLKVRDRRETKLFKDKDKKKLVEVPKVKFEIKLSGDSILAGVGRVVPFEKIGDRPNELGEIISIISSTNLPAQDDQPIIFVNIETLSDMPTNCLKKLRVSQVYTKWMLGEQIHQSEPHNITANKTIIKFNDHHALPMNHDSVSKVIAVLLENPFEIQLRGTRLPFQRDKPRLFGYKKGDQNFDASSSSGKLDDEDTDFLIAVTKIDAHIMAKGMTNFIRGDYSLYPLNVSVEDLNREAICSNDVNHIKLPLRPNIVVPTHVVLEAQMTLEVSMGLVGCKPKKLSESFARLYCLVKDTQSITTILKKITEINDEILQSGKVDDMLTGFAIDVGNLAMLYVEGPSNGDILKIWEMTEDFYPQIKPVFSSSNRYATRIYSALPKTHFDVLKMYVPLTVILACPPVYVRPALPYPTRSAVLKLGRLIAGKFREVPPTNEMPSVSELRSLRLELCVAPRPALLPQMEVNNKEEHAHATSSVQRINWDKHEAKTLGDQEK